MRRIASYPSRSCVVDCRLIVMTRWLVAQGVRRHAITWIRISEAAHNELPMLVSIPGVR
jgi:hypothetical protein